MTHRHNGTQVLRSLQSREREIRLHYVTILTPADLRKMLLVAPNGFGAQTCRMPEFQIEVDSVDYCALTGTRGIELLLPSKPPTVRRHRDQRVLHVGAV